MTTTKKIERPEGVPILCGRCRIGKVEYHEELTEHGLEGEWRCSECEKIYLPREDRQKYMELNYRTILRDLVFLGWNKTIKTHPLRPTEIKELTVEHADLLRDFTNEFRRERGKKTRGIKQIKLPKVKLGDDHNSPKLPEFCNDWSESVQLRWFDARDKELDRDSQGMGTKK